MTPNVVIVVQEDPLKTAKPVEALRIALGLTSGDASVTVVLLNGAVQLLNQDTDDIVDSEVLEQYLPSIKQLGMTFLVPYDAASNSSIDPGFQVRRVSDGDIKDLILTADRALVF